MKTKNFIRKTTGALLFMSLLLSSYSCEDFLAEESSNNIDSGYIYNTEDGLKSGVVSLYKFNRALYENGRHEWYSPIMMASRSDLALNRAGVLSLMGRYIWGVSPDGYQGFLVSEFWRHYYKIASKATEIINAAEVIEGIDEDVRNTVIAEAKFFRAQSYFMLYRMFNNIYVTTESVTLDNAFDLVENKSTDQEILALLNSDLSFAIDNLEWSSEFGRVTKGTAKHVKAKVAMWEGNWTEAKAQAESLIDEGPHSLAGSTAEVFNGDLNNSEQLFTIQYAEDVQGGSSASMINFNFIPRYEKENDFSDLRSEYGGKGGGFLMPNNYLLNLLAEDPDDDRDNENYYRLTYVYSSGPDTGEIIDLYEPTTDPNNPSPTNNQYYERTHPSCLKFIEEGNDPETQFQISNIMVYRLAETYLIAAEANMMLGNGGTAITQVNAIRARAGAADIAIVDQQAILDERARELAFEGQRFFTLKRMGISVLSHQITTYAGDDYYQTHPRTNWDDKYINFPIPTRDLDLLGPNYPQNNGF